MTEMMWIRSHVEQLLQREWDACQVSTDGDGDFPFRAGTALCWVTVIDAEPIMVRVFAHAAFGLKPTVKLFRELNAINLRCLSSHVLLSGETAIVSQSLSPVGLTQPVLAQAMSAVSAVADDIGPLLAAMFDGGTAFDAELTDSEDAA